MDGANYVHDEVLVKLWRCPGQFYGTDRIDDTVYSVDYHPVCVLYFGYICLQQDDFG